jgi:hypothetical protein
MEWHELNISFSKEEVQMAKENAQYPWPKRKCKSKPTMLTFHLTSVKMATIKSINNINILEDMGKKELSYTVGGNVN